MQQTLKRRHRPSPPHTPRKTPPTSPPLSPCHRHRFDVGVSISDHDHPGNPTTQPTGPNSRRLFTWDAWNRLVRVEVQDRPGLSDPWNAARTRAVYTYYGMHQRATAIADADLDLDAEVDRAEHFYYDAGWRLLERRRDVFANAAFGSEPAFTLDEVDQFVWGQRYIDELSYHRTAEGAGLYALTDRNFSVIAMSDDASEPKHRTRYTAYGEARTTLNADVNSDGVVNSIDQGLLLGAFGKGIGDLGYLVEADLNNDGIIDSSDFGILLGGFGQSVPPGDVSTTDTPVGYAGYLFDDATGLYCVRFRWYAPEIGRWLSRDPAGYVDGGSLVEYVRSRPVIYADSTGLVVDAEHIVGGGSTFVGGGLYFRPLVFYGSAVASAVVIAEAIQGIRLKPEFTGMPTATQDAVDGLMVGVLTDMIKRLGREKACKLANKMFARFCKANGNQTGCGNLTVPSESKIRKKGQAACEPIRKRMRENEKCLKARMLDQMLGCNQHGKPIHERGFASAAGAWMNCLKKMNECRRAVRASCSDGTRDGGGQSVPFEP